MMMPQGVLMWPHSFMRSTVQPMENMTIATITVSTALNTTLRTALKLLAGTRQFVPEQVVARGSHTSGTAVVTADIVIGEEKILSGSQSERGQQESFLRALNALIPEVYSSFSLSGIQETTVIV